jgi:hypothetical protein
MKVNYLCIFILWALVSCNSLKKGYSGDTSVILKQKPDVVDIKPSLKECLGDLPFCAMLFSPKVHPKNQKLKEGRYYTNYLYAAIISSLTNNNIIVNGEKLSSVIYASDKPIPDDPYIFRQPVDDLLIEFVGFEALKYYVSKAGFSSDVSEKEIKGLKKQYFIGQKLEFKIIHVLTGEVVGNFIYYYTPCTDGCNLQTNGSGNTGLINKKTGSTLNVDENYRIFESLLKRFVGDLLKYRNDSTVVAPVTKTIQSHNITIAFHPDNRSITFESGNKLFYNLTITDFSGERIVNTLVSDKQVINLKHLPTNAYFLEIKFNSIIVKNEIIHVIAQ